jgi:hypothetical protein
MSARNWVISHWWNDWKGTRLCMQLAMEVSQRNLVCDQAIILYVTVRDPSRLEGEITLQKKLILLKGFWIARV